MDEARATRRKITEWIESPTGPAGTDAKKEGTADDVKTFADRFAAAMDADLNVSAALAAIFDAMTWSRTHAQTAATLEALAAFQGTVRHTFGCFEPEERQELPDHVKALRDARQRARDDKNFAESDRLRAEIEKEGYEVRDEKGRQDIRIK
jgi:cysteinyl-tRNA synthetase